MTRYPEGEVKINLPGYLLLSELENVSNIYNQTRDDFGVKLINERLTKLDSQIIKSGQLSWIGELSCEVTEKC